MDERSLEIIGFTESECTVYFSLVESGESSAGEIIKNSGLYNSVVHRALNSLIDKGVVGFIMDGKRKIYSATDPDNLLDMIEERKKELKKTITEIKKKRIISREKTEAVIFRGRKGITEIYNILLNSGGREYNTYGGGRRVTYEIMGEKWWDLVHTKRIAKKIPSRQVFDGTARPYGVKILKMPLTKVRFLSNEFEQLTETVIIGEHVAINIFTDKPYGILIKDKVVSQSYKKNFELMWKRAGR